MAFQALFLDRIAGHFTEAVSAAFDSLDGVQGFTNGLAHPGSAHARNILGVCSEPASAKSSILAGELSGAE